MARRPRNMPLWLRLLIRRLRSPEGRLVPLAVISIAISVTLATGLEMASRSAQRQMEITAQAITGSAEIEVTAGQVGLAEEILEKVRATPGVRAASPLVSVKMRVVGQTFPLNVIGVDLVAEEQVRETAIDRNGLKIRDPLRLLATPNAVVVTQGLLERLGLAERYREGAPPEFRVRAYGKETTLVVQGVLHPTGIAAAFSGQVAVMDVYAAQELGGRTGLFDRIDIVPENGHEVRALIESLGAQLAGVATVQQSSGRSRAGEDLLQMVRRSALMLAGAAALVAALLTYATTAQWVERQRRQLATLRAVGMEARRVQRMVFVEVAVLATVGTAVGIGGGILISPPLLATLSQFLRVAAVEELTGVSLQASTIWVAVAVGLVASVSGSVLPAWRAGRRFTLDSLDLDIPLRRHRRLGFWVGVAALAAFASLLLVGRGIVVGAAMIRVAVMLVLGVVAMLGFGPTILRSLQLVLPLIEKISPAAGHLATRFFRARPWTFAVSMTAISTLVGALVAVFLLIATIGSAFDRWTESRYPAGAILIRPTSLTDIVTSELLTSRTLNIIRTTPGVIAVDEQYRNRPTVEFKGRTVPLTALSMNVVARHGHLASVGRPSVALAHDLHQGAVALSTGFARTFGLGQDDTIELKTPTGNKRFSVAGIFEDFGDATGSILLDLATFDAHWKRIGASAVVVWIDGPPEHTIAEIRRRVGEQQDLYVTASNELAAANRRYAEVFTSTLHVLGAFISSLGGLSVMILLTGIVAERRRDLAVLRAAGAEPRMLVAVVLLDSLALGILGCICGLALGFACAVPAADVLRESFGWILDQRWTAPELRTVIALTLSSVVVGALLPARMAYHTTADRVFGPE